MVTNATNLGRSGLFDWVIQRLTAVIVAVYFVGMMGYFVLGGPASYAEWKELMDCTAMKIATVVVIFAVAAHAWIGIWATTTDYLNKRVLAIKAGEGVAKYATLIRLACQALGFVLTLGYTVWGLLIVWGGV